MASRSRTATAGSQRSRGFIVIAVLWILAALSALVLIYMNFVTTTAVVVSGTTDRLRTDALAVAAVELAALQLTAMPETNRPGSGAFHARIGAARVAIVFRSEAARIDLNTADRTLLVGLLVGLGATPLNAAGYADRIVAWRSASDSADADPEDSLYRTSGLAYLPRHAPFPHVQELWLVLGLPPVFVERMLPHVTVLSNQRTVNILDAAPQVVAALPGMSPEVLQTILTRRGDARFDPQSLLALVDGAAATSTSAKSYRVAVTMEIDGGRAAAAEVVILLLEDANEPYRVLSWTNGFDGGAERQPQQAALR